MIQFTKTVTVEIKVGGNAVTTQPYTTTAKQYLLNIINSEDANIEKYKPSAASLLQYGTMLQVVGGATENFAMSPEEQTDWKNKGYLRAVGGDLSGGDAMKAVVTKDGTIEGLTISGMTLVMEDMTTLRLYFHADDITGLTFTVEGEDAVVKKSGSMYYMEAPTKVGTADLATMTDYVISDGTNTYTYRMCPLSYVYLVFNENKDHEDNSQELKNACEALYYYFDAVATCYGIEHGANFIAIGDLEVSEDQEGAAYSIPYGV